jgi:hypothetical protein
MRIMTLTICSAATVLAISLPSAMSAATIYTATLLGANEVPPTGSTATGSILVTLNGNTLTVRDLLGSHSSRQRGSHPLLRTYWRQ